MPSRLSAARKRLASDALAPVNLVTLAVVAIFALVTLAGAMRMPGGYDGTGNLNVVFALCAVIWVLGLATRAMQPGSRLGAAAQAVAMLGILTFGAALAAASLAPGGAAYVDPQLAAIDRVLMPFLDIPEMYRALDRVPAFYQWLCNYYVTLNWQPFAVMAAGLLFGNARRIDTLMAAWAIGLALCVLPFHFLPAQGTFTYYGLAAEGIGRDFVIDPGGDYPQVLAALRSGAMDTLSLDSVAGLVTVPSFHACSAVILACAFWPYRYLRWPMVLVNFAMALVAVPVGSHHLTDIVVGALCGAAAFGAAHRLAERRQNSSALIAIETRAPFLTA